MTACILWSLRKFLFSSCMTQKSHRLVCAICILNICYLVQCESNICIEHFLSLHHLYIETPSTMQSPKRYFGLKIRLLISILTFYCCYLEIVFEHCVVVLLFCFVFIILSIFCLFGSCISWFSS